MTTIIPFLLNLFVKPMITGELDKLRTHFDGVLLEHLKQYHTGHGGFKPGKARFNYRQEEKEDV
jgi:hypothetical protein